MKSAALDEAARQVAQPRPPSGDSAAVEVWCDNRKMPINVTICPDYGGWLPLFLDMIGPTRRENWPTLSPSVIRRLEAYNDWCLEPVPKNPIRRRREDRWWIAELSSLADAVQAELGDEYTVIR